MRIDQHLLSCIICKGGKPLPSPINPWENGKIGSKCNWGYGFRELISFSNTAKRDKRTEVNLLSYKEILQLSVVTSALNIVT